MAFSKFGILSVLLLRIVLFFWDLDQIWFYFYRVRYEFFLMKINIIQLFLKYNTTMIYQYLINSNYLNKTYR